MLFGRDWVDGDTSIETNGEEGDEQEDVEGEAVVVAVNIPDCVERFVTGTYSVFASFRKCLELGLEVDGEGLAVVVFEVIE